MSVQYDKPARAVRNIFLEAGKFAKKVLAVIRTFNLWRRAARPPDVPSGLRKDMGLRNEYQPPDWRELR